MFNDFKGIFHFQMLMAFGFYLIGEIKSKTCQRKRVTLYEQELKTEMLLLISGIIVMV